MSEPGHTSCCCDGTLWDFSSEYWLKLTFPGSFQIGRKDRLWRNCLRCGSVLDVKLLKKAWEDSGYLHKCESDCQRKRPTSPWCTKYLHKPYLISGNKFDLRIYVYVTSYEPLLFTSSRRTRPVRQRSSVNKKNSDYQIDSDKTCQGHKWALKALWHYLGSKGVDTTLIWEEIKDIVIKTIIASDPYVNTLVKMHLRSSYSCHELFGFDVMLDENLKPWVLEVNISPSLHSSTALDVTIKGQMIRDVLNLAGFLLPQREEVHPSFSSSGSSSSSLSGGTRERTRSDISTDEKVKRAFYLSQRFCRPGIFMQRQMQLLVPCGSVDSLVLKTLLSSSDPLVPLVSSRPTDPSWFPQDPLFSKKPSGVLKTLWLHQTLWFLKTLLVPQDPRILKTLWFLQDPLDPQTSGSSSRDPLVSSRPLVPQDPLSSRPLASSKNPLGSLSRPSVFSRPSAFLKTSGSSRPSGSFIDLLVLKDLWSFKTH
nr:LOW QUALITY PROTEIN: tubulin polyglutamylase TTLL4-like [Salvelinus alpinus]